MRVQQYLVMVNFGPRICDKRRTIMLFEYLPFNIAIWNDIYKNVHVSSMSVCINYHTIVDSCYGNYKLWTVNYINFTRVTALYIDINISRPLHKWKWHISLPVRLGHPLCEMILYSLHYNSFSYQDFSELLY